MLTGKKKVEIWNLKDIDIETATLGLAGSPTKVQKSFTKSVKDKGVVYDDVSPKEAAKLIVDKLTEKYIL